MFNIYGTFQFLISVDFCICTSGLLEVKGQTICLFVVLFLFCFLIRIPVSFHHVRSFLSGRKSSVYHEEGEHGRHLGCHHSGVVGSNGILSLHTFLPLHSNAVHILHFHHVLETAAQHLLILLSFKNPVRLMGTRIGIGHVKLIVCYNVVISADSALDKQQMMDGIRCNTFIFKIGSEFF